MTAKRYRVRLEYPQLARFQQILAQLGGSQEDESYAVNVELTAVVPQDDWRAIRGACAGSVQCRCGAGSD